MTDSEDWYYEDGGRARGPVTRDQLVELLVSAFVPPSARVWTPAFGDEWRSVDQTDLLPRRPMPPPLPPTAPSPAGLGTEIGPTGGNDRPTQQGHARPDSGEPAGARKASAAGYPPEPGQSAPTAALGPANGMPDPMPPPGYTPNRPSGRATDLDGGAPTTLPAEHSAQHRSPPLLTTDDLALPTHRAGPATPPSGHAAPPYIPPGANKPLDTFAQLLAFSPLIFAALDLMVAVSGNDPNGDNRIARALPYWITVGTIVLAVMDSRRIADHGLNPQRRTLAPFVLLTPIGYFIRRNGVVPHSLRFLWIWLASVVGFFVIEIAIIAARG